MPFANNKELRVVLWNVEHDGVDADGSTYRQALARDVMAGLRPHIVLRQEHSPRHGRTSLWAEARKLRLGDGPAFFPFLASATPESPNATAVFVDPLVCTPTAEYQHATGIWHPVCNPVITLPGAATPLSLASFHLCHFDGERRAQETRRLTTLGRPGMAALIGGDCNCYVHRQMKGEPELPDWTTVADRSHYEHRTIWRDGKRVSDTVPDEILAGEPEGLPPLFRELGHYAATELDQSEPDPLAATSSLWRTDQGPMRRIDRMYATPQVAEALTRLEVIATDEVREASDHALVLATFSLPKLTLALSTTSPTAHASTGREQHRGS